MVHHKVALPPLSQVKLEFGMLVFVEGGNPENPEKILGARMRTNCKFNPRDARSAN